MNYRFLTIHYNRAGAIETVFILRRLSVQHTPTPASVRRIAAFLVRHQDTRYLRFVTGHRREDSGHSLMYRCDRAEWVPSQTSNKERD